MVVDLLPVQHLANGGIVHCAHAGVMDLEREVEVTDLPDQRNDVLLVGGVGDLDDGFSRLFEDVAFTGAVGGAVNDHTRSEAVLEVEAEFGVVFGDCAPAQFREIPTFDGDGDSRFAGRGRFWQWRMNDVHQNRK